MTVNQSIRIDIFEVSNYNVVHLILHILQYHANDNELNKANKTRHKEHIVPMWLEGN